MIQFWPSAGWYLEPGPQAITGGVGSGIARGDRANVKVHIHAESSTAPHSHLTEAGCHHSPVAAWPAKGVLLLYLHRCPATTCHGAAETDLAPAFFSSSQCPHPGQQRPALAPQTPASCLYPLSPTRRRGLTKSGRHGYPCPSLALLAAAPQAPVGADSLAGDLCLARGLMGVKPFDCTTPSKPPGGLRSPSEPSSLDACRGDGSAGVWGCR